MTNSIEEIVQNEVIFVTGSNTTENHPVIGSIIRQAIKKGSKLIVADPRRIDLANDATIYIPLKPGTNAALINGMMKYILDNELMDKDFIRERTEDFEILEETLKDCSLEKAASICGIESDLIVKAAKLYASAKKAAIYYAMGVTQHSHGTQQVMAISNLALLTGNVGKEGTGINPLRGQNNVQGAGDMGGLPDVYPGYKKVFDDGVVDYFKKKWNVENLPDKKGLTIPKMIDASLNGKVKFMYIMGENPLLSDPDYEHALHAFKSVEFLIVQDIFLTQTASIADVVLPASAFAEKDGTFVNTERRVQRIRKAIQSPGISKPDWEIISLIIEKLGNKNIYSNSEDVFKEICDVVPQFYGIKDYSRIEKKGLQWPVPSYDHPGTKFMHENTFSRGKGRFMPIKFEASAENPDEYYNMIMTTGRILYHYHTRTMTGKIEGLNEIAPESFMEISPLDAKDLNITNNEKVRVISRRGAIEVKTKITSNIKDGVIFIPFHYDSSNVNMLTNNENLDEYTDMAELKVTAVRVEKIL
jgi:formate dehydrogenase major subunit